MKAIQVTLAALILTVLAVGDGLGQPPRQDAGRKAGVERFLTVGDYRFHYSDQGAGAPVVVLDAGLCQAMDTWGDVPASVAEFTRVFAYDRLGLGKSYRITPPAANRPAIPSKMRTSYDAVQELRDLLRKAGLPAPYTLVGHSFGGVNMLLYASQYPNEVAGIVLVDSSHEDGYSRYVRLISQKDRAEYTRTERGGNCEGMALMESYAQLRSAAPLPPVPFKVLTALGAVERERTLAHVELQADLARRAPNSDHLIVERSGHFIQRDRPDVVIEAIRNVTQRARHASIPLPTEEDLKQTRILHAFISTEAAFSGAALTLTGLLGWRWRKRKREGKAEPNRARRRQALREEKGKK